MLHSILKGLAITLLLIFSVGPVFFTIIKQSITNGKAGGFSFVFGVWMSDLLWVVLSNAFSEIVDSLLHFKQTIGFAGSVFLIGLGVFYLFFKKVHIQEDENKIVITSRTHAKLFLSGFFINTLNPAVIIFWLTTATAIAASNTVQERIIIFSTCLLCNLSADVFKVFLAQKLRSKLNEHTIKLINKLTGLLLMVFGAALLLGVIFTVVKH